VSKSCCQIYLVFVVCGIVGLQLFSLGIKDRLLFGELESQDLFLSMDMKTINEIFYLETATIIPNNCWT